MHTYYMTTIILNFVDNSLDNRDYCSIIAGVIIAIFSVVQSLSFYTFLLHVVSATKLYELDFMTR